jgi:hypothetical protein
VESSLARLGTSALPAASSSQKSIDQPSCTGVTNPRGSTIG